MHFLVCALALTLYPRVSFNPLPLLTLANDTPMCCIPVATRAPLITLDSLPLPPLPLLTVPLWTADRKEIRRSCLSQGNLTMSVLVAKTEKVSYAVQTPNCAFSPLSSPAELQCFSSGGGASLHSRKVTDYHRNDRFAPSLFFFLSFWLLSLLLMLLLLLLLLLVVAFCFLLSSPCFRHQERPRDGQDCRFVMSSETVTAHTSHRCGITSWVLLLLL
ncbi:hypothetical protein BD289DRAFT_182549 [Coniella lustricola]|uniref:Uncharacterized protein n=1 Tax=Coniella lustricola TaxID=2025994 RepID=A0A2T2ZTB7_9PEZI|nr:hypothetical protein BD289DRAFT_182549 [Coniella lustricola]